MHAYLSNQEERRRVHFVLTLISIPIAWGLNWGLNLALTALGLSLWWLDAPAVWGIYLFLCKGFSRYAWRLNVLRKLGLVITPDLSGSYTGKLRTSHDGDERDVRMRILQEFDRILIRWEGPLSKSKSVAASVTLEDGTGTRLQYSYKNEPDTMAPSTLVSHDGTCELEFDGTGIGLRGHYYNGRGRMNCGAVEFVRQA